MTGKKSSHESDQEWDEDSKISYSSTKRRHLIIALMALIVIIVGAGVAYAAISLSLKETAPPITNNPPLLSGCDPLTATPPSVPTGSSGGILFTCGPQGGTLGALTINGPVTASESFSPTPTGYTAIYIIPQGAACSASTTSAQQIFGTGSTATITFTISGQVDYCAIFTNAPAGGFATWTITWTWTQ